MSRRDILSNYAEYAAREEKKCGDKRLHRVLIKPLWNLFHGEYNGKAFRVEIEKLLRDKRELSIRDIILSASEYLPREVLDNKSPVLENK